MQTCEGSFRGLQLINEIKQLKQYKDYYLVTS